MSTPWLHPATIARAQEGDAAAWAMVVGRYDGLLRGYIAKRVPDRPADVDDLVQQTWVWAWSHLTAPERAGRPFPPGLVARWLCRVAETECRVAGRTRRLPLASLDALLAEGAVEPVAPNAAYDRERTRRAVGVRVQRQRDAAAARLERAIAVLEAFGPTPERHAQLVALRRELAKAQGERG